MTIKDKAVLVTGANRGIGQALVEESLEGEARKRVYAGTRHPFLPLGRGARHAPDAGRDQRFADPARQPTTSTPSTSLINNAGVRHLRRSQQSRT